MAKRRATTQAPDTGTVDSAMGGGRRGVRRPSGYAGRIESGGRGDLGDQALGENNRGTGGKGAPSTGFGAGAPGSTGGGDLGQGTGGGVVETTTPAYDQPIRSGDDIPQSYLDNFQTGVEMTPEVDSSGSALPGRQPVNPISAYPSSPTASRTATPLAAQPGAINYADNMRNAAPRTVAPVRGGYVQERQTRVSAPPPPKPPTSGRGAGGTWGGPTPPPPVRGGYVQERQTRVSAPTPPPPPNTTSFRGKKIAQR